MTLRTQCLSLVALATTLAATAVASGTQKGVHCPYRVVTKHFDVEFSVPPRIGRGYASLCEKAYSKFSKVFEVPSTAVVWNGKCKVMLFASRQEFARFASVAHGAGAALSGGYTQPRKDNPIIVLFLHGRDHVKLQQVLIHEMTHVFLQLFGKEVHIHTWLHEGFAQLFEFQHHPERSRLRMSRAMAKALVRGGKTRPLKQFWVQAFPPTDHYGYAQAWSLTDFMTGSKELRRKTGKFVLELKKQAPEQKGFVHIKTPADLKRVLEGEVEKAFARQARVFKAIYGISVEEFEARWKRYVLATY